MSSTHDDGRNSAVFAVGWLDELAESAGKRSRFQNLGGPAGFFLRRGTRRIKITVLRLFFPGKKNKKPAVTPKLPLTIILQPEQTSIRLGFFASFLLRVAIKQGRPIEVLQGGRRFMVIAKESST